MNSIRFISRVSFVLLFSSLTICLYSQDKKESNGFVPHVGQAGKDVIWVPTPFELVNKMLEIAKVTPGDFVIDLGSGDGRTVIAAAKLGATATGIEYNPDMVSLSKKKAEEAGVSDKATFLQADLFQTDLSKATVITMFLLPEINLKLRPVLLDLKPGTRIVSNTFTMGEWQPDVEVTLDDITTSWNTALMWIVPAKVEGTWKLIPGEIKLNQEFQVISGTYQKDGEFSKILDGKMNGDMISFIIAGAKYSGKVSGNTISGTVTTDKTKSDFKATLIDETAK